MLSFMGGFYGGCSESAMMLELVKNGPMGVAFEVGHTLVCALASYMSDGQY